MDPIRLYMKDFCSHSETEFSFTEFQSALIIGKIKGNERFSNASGKSTIPNAIAYVLFNEIQFSTLDKVVRNGCESCTVEMDFLSSLDNCVYRVRRSTSHKSGTDIRLFRKDGDAWTDMTQRRPTDTEKELLKIIGFNYRVFCASSLFVQPGAENNTQKEFGNLPALTVEKRKAVLREILQLNVYSSYEKIAKTKTAQISGEIEKNAILLSSLGDPAKEIGLLQSEIAKNREKITTLETKKEEVKKTLESHHLELAEINAEMSASKSQKEAYATKEREIAQAIARLNNALLSLNKVMKDLPLEGKAIAKRLEESKSEMASLKESLIDISKVIQDRSSAQQLFANLSAENQMIDRQTAELNKPLPNGPDCSLCHQTLSDEHRHNWDDEVKDKLVKLSASKQDNQSRLLDIRDSLKQYDALIAKNDKVSRTISQLEKSISLLDKDIAFKRSEFKNTSENYESNKSLLKEKTEEMVEIRDKLSKMDLASLEQKEAKISELNSKISVLKRYKDDFSQEMSQMSSAKAVAEHKIEKLKEDEQKISDFAKKSLSLQGTLNVHQKVVEAFSSGGIPSLIIQSVLDDFQDEANKWLSQLHPGIQLQFIISKDNSKKQQEDTLDIQYFIGGAEMEYRQLSGAQKMLVSLAIKLAIIYIMNRKLGVSVKLMLLDEVDQPLDPGTAEIFADAIKVLHKDIKILAITHNPELKHKFSHAIVVDQDENNVSSGRLNAW